MHPDMGLSAYSLLLALSAISTVSIFATDAFATFLAA